MIELRDKTIEYFDDAVCLQSGIYKQGQHNISNNITSPEISVVPNPATEQVEIKINGTLDGLCNIAIINMLGEIAIAEQMLWDQHSKKIDVHLLTSGIYTVKVRNNTIVKTAKLVINR